MVLFATLNFNPAEGPYTARPKKGALLFLREQIMTNTNIETKAREIIEEIFVELAWDDREEFRKDALAALEDGVFLAEKGWDSEEEINAAYEMIERNDIDFLFHKED